MNSRVVRLDLKGCDADEAVSRVADLLNTPQDLGMLLVEDTASAAVRHRAAFEALDGSRQVTQLLCLLLGRQPGEDGSGGGLRLPGNIQRRTLWVIEETGVDWPLRAAARARRRDGRDGDGLGRLSELLRLPGVFERTCRLLGEVPFGAAVPGLHVAGAGGTGQEDFLQALRTAIRRMLDPASPPAVPHGDERPAGRVPLRLTKDGVLQRAFDDAARAVDEAREDAGELPGIGALIRELPVAAPVEAAGERTAELRGRLGELFQAVPADDRITEERQAAIIAKGVQPPVLETFEAEPFREHLGSWLRGSIARGASLPRLDQDLRERAGTLERRGAYGRRLGQICSSSLLHRLRNPPPMPPPQDWLPVPGAIFAALAGLSPVGVAGGLVMALLWTALVALTVIRGPGGRIEDHSRALAFNALGALAGAIAGGLGGAAGLPAAAWAAAVFAAVAGALVTIARSWRARALHWVDDTELDTAEQALRDMHQLLGQAVTGWSRLNRRLDAIDELNLLRQGLNGVRDELEARSRELDKENLPQPSRSVAPFGEAVQFWLGDLVFAAVKPAQHGGPDGGSGPLARKETSRLIDDWESAVEQGLSVDTLPFVTDARPATLIGGEDLAYLTEQVSYDPAGEMWQLCAPGDLGLLDAAPEPRTVRFGPRPVADGAGYPPGTVLVSSSAHCGVLRLVPLHSHVVEWTWTEDEHGQDEHGQDEQAEDDPGGGEA
ncbi:hypothetical protein [Actinomadura sp. 7K507]|uniref:hypothetical protein n=1 Tax=Actinomadura sp. 7K507 TaxID=2530365 RepID=UPI0010474A0F|nr:hypothetical protein [Actinomadura sp. 7K507]TDC83523.1 hypothetical protein E1285_28735 [Actinomadura sp. 7K507]